MSWGTYYGSAPWGWHRYDTGAQVETAFNIVNVWAISPMRIRVEFDAPPKLYSPLRVGDVTNTDYWSVKTPEGDTMPVLAVVPVEGSDTAVDVVIFGRWSGALDTFSVSLSDLAQSNTGVSVGVTSANFMGVTDSLNGTGGVVYASQDGVDLENIQDGTARSGLRITASGDYAREGGTPFVKKLIIRALSSYPGDFLLWDKQYGAGLNPKIRVTQAYMQSLKDYVEAQVSVDRSVKSVKASVYYSKNTLRLSVSVKLGEATQPETVNILLGPPTDE